MKLKQLMAGATIAGALGAAALGVGAGAASARRTRWTWRARRTG